MKIIIDDRYFIETDKYNYILREKIRIAKEKELRKRSYKYDRILQQS